VKKKSSKIFGKGGKISESGPSRQTPGTRLNDQDEYSYDGTDDSQDFLFVHAGGEQGNGEKGKEQYIRVSYRFMVPGIGSQFDPFHIQQINRKGEKCAGEDNRQEKPQLGFILKITSYILATDEAEK
jgi:hypothetical protein